MFTVQKKEFGKEFKLQIRNNCKKSLSSPCSCFFASKTAFTLAEVLITLALIGVVAVLTISPVITSYKEKVVVTKVRKFYADINNAFRLAEIKEGKVKNWGWTWGTLEGSRNAINIIAKYVNTAKFCRNTPACSSVSSETDSIMLKNGTILGIYSSALNCQWDYTEGNVEKLCGSIDLKIQEADYVFSFFITQNGIVPRGARGSQEKCSRETLGNCTAWVIEKGNLDYLKREVSWDE